MKTKNMLSVVLIVLFNLMCVPAFAVKVALTFDDLPAAGKLPTNTTRREVVTKIISVLNKHHLIHVYGLINGGNLSDATTVEAILQDWVRGGQLLGNHTYHHFDLAKVTSTDYIADIERNEMLLAKWMKNRNYHYFRYPYLSEGNTQEKRDEIRQYLFKHGYRIAPVTVDFFDYEWNSAYVRCQKNHDENAIAWLKKSYIENALNALTISHALSGMLFNRDIKNIMLIHINAFNAEMLDELLTHYERQGVRFIALPDALRDPVYRINPNVVKPRAYTFLNKVRLSRNLPNPDIVSELYAQLPEKQLRTICT